jgi:hypothetical protein
MTLPAEATQESDFTLDSFIQDLTTYLASNPNAKSDFE